MEKRPLPPSFLQIPLNSQITPDSENYSKSNKIQILEQLKITQKWKNQVRKNTIQKDS